MKIKKRANQYGYSKETNLRLIESSKSSSKDLFERYNNTENGFDIDSVDLMREEYGENVISQHDEENIIIKFIKAFINPFTLVLFGLALISLFTDIIFASKKDPSAVIIVLVMVSISGILRFIQEAKSSRAAERLKAMIKVTTCVKRIDEDGESKKIEIPLSEVVVGDVIYLAAGDMIPADVRIISCKDLFVSQSSLTGESEPIEKTAESLIFSHSSPIELNNLAFMGTNVVSGSAVAVAIATGDDTMFGSIAKNLTNKKVTTSFERGVNSVSFLLIRFMFIMVPIVFLINGFTKDWLSALFFALSIAVGLTPEMLPMIVTTNLANGASRMAKKKTVIKNLNSIQNFGAMDVLCTDKTGTLTQDKVILERYLDIHGNSDTRVLRHAFLNSYFQTGLKNLMDIAILNHIRENNLSEVASRYIKVDEIPFDFNRRRMSVVIKDRTEKTQLITKGAVEEMLSICSYAEYNGAVEPLTTKMKEDILSTVNKLNLEGMRVLGIAQKTNPSSVGLFSVKDESEMVLIGYLAFLDPPKETATSAIKALKEYGVDVKVLTGDNVGVTLAICKQVGIRIENVLLGKDIDDMDEESLKTAVEKTNVFAKLSPQQKTRIVGALRSNNHVVGFMGDGINDAMALKEADVGISVDTAVDIAKESADIILLQKDLMILEQGVIEGRKTFANIIKYIKMTASSNFGNMFSVLIACAFLPFLPMMPLQLLVLNLIYDISCISIPWDNVDNDYLKKPRKWEASSIAKFMFFIGPVSSLFDILTYLILYFVICPSVMGGGYATLSAQNQLAFTAIFNAGWFVESLWSQTLVIHMIRTPKVPFIKSRASAPVLAFTTLAILIGTIIPFINPVATSLDLLPFPKIYFVYLFAIILAYMGLITIMKKLYIKRYKELL